MADSGAMHIGRRGAGTGRKSGLAEQHVADIAAGDRQFGAGAQKVAQGWVIEAVANMAVRSESGAGSSRSAGRALPRQPAGRR